ncbi:MAG: cupin-like domain-containing protein [Sphingomonadales bacterium]|nr:cupin-like domain-containing protein [Sphingomonadales bacterium]
MNDSQSFVAASATRASLIEPADQPRFADVNVRPFGFRHALADRLPLTIDDVRALGERLPDGEAFKAWQNGRIDLEDGWHTRPAERLSLARTLDGIASNDSLVVFKHIEQDPVFGPVLQDLLQDVFRHASARFRDDVVLGECLVFLNSPSRKTAYHFDLEASFLLQISGHKTVHAWPSGDPSIVSEDEVADYCGAGNLSAAIYRPEKQAAAMTFELEAGDGVHFPSLGPHWVQNHDTVSISINVNYDLRSLHGRRRHVYAFNHRMAKLGLHPTGPGQQAWADLAKAQAWIAAREVKSTARRVLGQRRSGEGYPVWRPDRTRD